MHFDRRDELAELASIRTVERQVRWNTIATNAAMVLAVLISLILLLRMLRSTATRVSETMALPPRRVGVLVGGPEEIEGIPGYRWSEHLEGEREKRKDSGVRIEVTEGHELGGGGHGGV